ncbi:DUF3667 domain-containing protein [Chitinophagaceae bacterium LWZ2-11]
MSHLKERKEKDCLNCGTEVQGRYCQNCGQENIEPKETFWHLVTHFVYDVTHFDGKFFWTVKYLLFRPGYLSAEYIKGKRMTYLNPIRMYIFISAIFFLAFFSLFKPGEKNIKVEDRVTTVKSMKQSLHNKKEALEDAIETTKPWSKKAAEKMQIQVDRINADSALLEKDTTQLAVIADHYKTVIIHNDMVYNNYKEYDSIQATLPEDKKDNFITSVFFKREMEMRETYGDRNKVWQHMIEKFFHSFPQILFVSLPLFALILQLLYVRRPQFYYVNHLIFSVHLYCAMFLLMLVQILLGTLADRPHFGWVSWIEFAIGIYILYYTYKAMRNFYGQRRGKTILKYILLNFTSFFLMILLFAVFFIISILIMG